MSSDCVPSCLRLTRLCWQHCGLCLASETLKQEYCCSAFTVCVISFCTVWRCIKSVHDPVTSPLCLFLRAAVETGWKRNVFNSSVHPIRYITSVETGWKRNVFTEADLGMCGRTGAPTKRGPHMRTSINFFIAANLLQHANMPKNHWTNK